MSPATMTTYSQIKKAKILCEVCAVPEMKDALRKEKEGEQK
jgi:hypothetical protein